MRYVSLAVEDLQPWSRLNNVVLHGVKVASNIVDHEGNSKGGGLLATSDHGEGDVLLNIPSDIILSRSQVDQCSKVDPRLRELLEAVPSLTQTARGIIGVFLLYQMTIGGPDVTNISGTVQGPLTDYVKFLPKDIPLPTFYSLEERELLQGTSLGDALDQKLLSLEKEFDQLKAATEGIGWCSQRWWNEDSDFLTIEDWKLADAMYRSRALELPRGVGDAMLPVVDMANHASDGRANARFEVDDNGNALLVVRDDKSILRDEEITIMYGCGGASEMIFSYGFLEEGATSARELFLSLSMPEDDPLSMAKIHFAKEAPGVRLFVDIKGHVGWDSNFVWWACINEEDGLDFSVVQSIDGERELQGFWKGEQMKAESLRNLLMTDDLSNIFKLRAVVLIEERVTRQVIALAGSDSEMASEASTRGAVLGMIKQLRGLELELLSAAQEHFAAEKSALLKTPEVIGFLSRDGDADADAEAGSVEEDFS